MIEGKVLNDCATIVNCQMHGLNNCLSTALIAAFGDAGLNRNNNSNSVFQAAYVYVYVSERMMKKMNEDVGNDGLKEIHECIVERMKTNQAWKNEANWQNRDNFEVFMTTMMDAIEDDDEEKLLCVLEENYKNVQDTVFSRWMSGEIHLSILVVYRCQVSLTKRRLQRQNQRWW